MIKDIIDKVLKELNVNNLSDDDKFAVMEQLTDHFNKIILDTVLSNLNDEQLIEFKNMVDLEDMDKMEEGIALIVAKIPAINFKIEEAINNEIAHIKESKAIIDR